MFLLILFVRHKTPESRKNRSKKLRAKMNKDLKKIAENVGIDGKITSYIARPTWAMVQKISLRNPTSMISDALGHKTEDVTRAYLESFKTEDLDEMNRGIL